MQVGQRYQPQVVAHRGASAENAEHTLGAYLKALEAGADGVECDVRLTADGHLVCVHDRDLKRTAATRGAVSTLDLTDLDKLDFAAWKNPWRELGDEATDPDPELVKVLTLRKLLETVADCDRRIEIAIETKHPTRYAGLVERRLAQMLRDFGWQGAHSPVRMMSFSSAAVQRMSKLTPDLQLVQLVDTVRGWQLVRGRMPGRWVLGPGVSFLREHPRTALRMAQSRHDLHVWTVNTEDDLALCEGLGVSAVITDKPDYILDLLGR